MHLRLLRAAAAVALLGGTATVGLGFTQAAVAATTNVDCNTADLITAMTDYTSGDTLVLAPHCTYWLTAQLPSVMHTLTLEGPATLERQTASGSFSVLVVGCANGHLTLENVNIRNGGGDIDGGGAVDVTNSDASLTVYGGTFSYNTATAEDSYGGAIDNEGTLTVDGATLTDNSAEYGGAIYSDNTVADATLNHDSFIGNDALDGGAIYNDDNNMQVNEGNFRYDSAAGEDASGGAIYNDYDLTATDTLFSMNTAFGEDAAGGAIYNDDEDVTLNHSLLTANRATDGGGGIYWYNDDDGGTNVTLHFDEINANVPNNCDPTETIDGCVG
jgi:predicted outer membrane repeat protein